MVLRRILIAVCLLAATARADFVFYVSPSGNDSNPGTTTALPLRTLTGARNALRNARANDPTDSLKSATIYLRSGVYWTSSDLGNTLNQLQLDAQDSGQAADYAVLWTSYPGETAVVHGGVRLLNWSSVATVGTDTIWKTSISSWYPSHWSAPRDLYVNNRRMIRARYPDLTYVSGTPVPANSSFLQVLDNFPGDPNYGKKFLVAGNLPAVDPAHLGYTDSGAFQAIARTEWVAPRQRITSAAPSGANTLITLTNVIGVPTVGSYTVWGPGGRGPGFPGDPMYLEGALEFLYGPSSTYEWYLQPTANAQGQGQGDLWVRLPSTLNPNTSTSVVAPRSSFLARLSGVQFASFVNIDFAFTNFDAPVLPAPAPATGWFPRGGGYSVYTDINAEYPFPAAFVADSCSNVYISRCRVAHTGAGGMALRLGSTNTFEACEVFDTGATGIFVGRQQVEWEHTDKPYNCSVRDNYVHDAAVTFADAVGIKLDWVDNLTVFRNEIARVPYAGLHAGVWGEDYTSSGGLGHSNQAYCAWNKIHDAVTWLNDGGAFHPVGATTGCSFHDNVIHAVFPDYWYGGGRRGMEMDVNAAGWVINNNVVYSMVGSAVPFVDGNCASPYVNVYPTPANYFDEHSTPGFYCGGLSEPSGTVIEPNLATSPSPAAAAIINAAGPSSIFTTYLYSTFDVWVHPY
jgi:hypothetical protein